MSVIADVVKALVAAGASGEQIWAAVAALEKQNVNNSGSAEEVERRRKYDRERKRAWRSKRAAEEAIQVFREQVEFRLEEGLPVNPRALGINPRALGTNPRARRK